MSDDTDKIHLQLEDQIARAQSMGATRAEVAGTLSPTAISFLITQLSNSSAIPHLVVTSTDSEAEAIVRGVGFFAPQQIVKHLPAFDISPYEGLAPKRNVASRRCGFLWAARQALPGQIFVASVQALMQKTLSFGALNENYLRLQKSSLVSSDFSERLGRWGYQAAPTVEDVGQFCIRGGLIDVFPPTSEKPVRIELFGDQIESLRSFDPETQTSIESLSEITLIPCREFIWGETQPEKYIDKFREMTAELKVPKVEIEESLRSLARGLSIDNIDFIGSFFRAKSASPLDHFSQAVRTWVLDPIELSRAAEDFYEKAVEDYRSADSILVRPLPADVWIKYSEIVWPESDIALDFYSVETHELTREESRKTIQLAFPSFGLKDLRNQLSSKKPGSEEWVETLSTRLDQWKKESYFIGLSVRTASQAERLRVFLSRTNWICSNVLGEQLNWRHLFESQATNRNLIHIFLKEIPESVRIPAEKIVLLHDEDLWGKKAGLAKSSNRDEFQKANSRLSFGDLSSGDYVVHTVHGIGIYDGLKLMEIGGAPSEFIQISYKDKDKLYLPVYRIGQLNRFSGHAAQVPLDRLGSGSFEKTKVKVKSALQDLAAELLKLYAERASHHRPQIQIKADEFHSFESQFPYDETQDQLRAVDDMIKDFGSDKPMDRLICGDVGFGKTEIAMRAAFMMMRSGRQVALLCPTTVLTFQHFETLKKRFTGWPIEVRALNRFVSQKDIKKTLSELKQGSVDIVVGTHRLLSKDVEFKNLGLLIVDEEQKFGVAAKEKIRKAKAGVDTLAMSATPIPRSLNMSLMSIRDLSLINTAPVDRLPTRTFVSRWDIGAIRKACMAEVQRGGQIYFIHNRVQSIYGIAAELREAMPELRIGVGHGQMEEHELEKTMVTFFNHEVDMLVCTTIVESGMDVPRANTMFIDQAHTLGLSQLYQLRGRVGRSKHRAYCYLLTPRGRQLDKLEQERLKVIQDNSALGSGIRIAQYDLELRGAGNLLGDAQSGHIDTVGYELYMDLLEEAIANLRGEPRGETEVDPEINLRIPALIPETYMPDIRQRLSYYKALSTISGNEDLESIESELRDQFGDLPEPVLNLMGLMLIRSQCKKLSIRDLSAGPKNVTLQFTEATPLKPETVIRLAAKENKKYALLPDNRLSIRLNEITWARVHDELNQLMASANIRS